MRFKKLLIIGTTSCLLLNPTQILATERIDTKTQYNNVKVATVYNHEESNLIHVVDENNMDDVLFKMKTEDEFVYTTTENVNIRISPNISTDPYASLPLGSKLHLVGSTMIGWSLVQIDNVNYFIWDEYITEAIPKQINDSFDLNDYIYDNYKIEVSESATSDQNINNLTSLGVWNITGYCPCVECCGQWSGSNTASGAPPTSNHTIATNELPFGTQLLINGIIYTVEDRGGSPYYPWADIYFDTHDQAESWGLRQIEVFLIG